MQLRLETEQARQDELKASAQAQAEQARQEGEIRVAQSRIQEEARQQLTLAQLNKEKIQAQKAVIEAERVIRWHAQRPSVLLLRRKSPTNCWRPRATWRSNAGGVGSSPAGQGRHGDGIRAAAILAANPELLQLKTVEANASARSLPISLSLRRMAPRRPLSCPVLGSSQRWTITGTAATAGPTEQ